MGDWIFNLAEYGMAIHLLGVFKSLNQCIDRQQGVNDPILHTVPLRCGDCLYVGSQWKPYCLYSDSSFPILFTPKSKPRDFLNGNMSFNKNAGDLKVEDLQAKSRRGHCVCVHAYLKLNEWFIYG